MSGQYLLTYGGAAALATAVAAVPSHADPAPAITAALDRFQAVCATAFEDPETYVGSLTLPGPSGEPGLYPSADGRYMIVLTAQSQGITDRVEFAGLAGRQIRRCEVSAILPGFPENAAIAAAVRPLLEARATEVVGGMTRTMDPIWEPDNEPVVFEGEPFHMFHASGLFPGLDVIASIRTGTGSLVLRAERIVATGEVTQ